MITLTLLMFWVLLGHFVGDYLVQNKWMALSKGLKGWQGIRACLLHCLLYTLTVGVAACFFLGNWTAFGWIALMVFLTHYPIDRWSLADKWLKLIRGRQLDEVFKEAAAAMPHPKDGDIAVDFVGAAHVADVATRQAFTALVYAAADNTLHFLLMTAGFATLLHFGVI